MIQYIKNYKIYLISVFLSIVCFMLCNCSNTERKSIIFHDYRINKDYVRISLCFNLQNKLYKKVISSNTKSVNILSSSELCCVEQESSFCSKIIFNEDNIHVYLFPNEIVKNEDDSYVVGNANGVYAFYIEYYDSISEKNYYIFSKDNIIKKEAEIYYSDNYFNELQKVDERDIGYYNEDIQPLGYPYAGYVVRDHVGNLMLLSTLWDSYTIN